MPSYIWNREDIRNILLAIYAAKFPPLDQEPAAGEADPAERLYRWGYRVAIQSLMLAFGLPLQLLDRAVEQPAPAEVGSAGSTQLWWIEDLERVIAAVYRSGVSVPAGIPDHPEMERYRQGFDEVIALVLEAIGSRADPRGWYNDIRADRYWIFSPPEEGTPPKFFGAEEEEGV